MPNIENFIPKRKLFKSKDQINSFGNIQNIGLIIDSLTNTNQKGLEKQTEIRTNLGQTRDKHRTNLGQDGNKSRTNLGQTKDKLKTNLSQNQDKPKSKPRTNLGQVEAVYDVCHLSGLQLKIMLFLINSCKLCGRKSTGALYIQTIMDHCGAPKLSIQKSIQRLELKNVIIRKSFKNGRGGWTEYEIPERIFNDMLTLESTMLIKRNLGQNLGQTKDITCSSSSLDLNYNTTNYLNSASPHEPEFNLGPLSEIGFTETHAKQIVKQGKLTPDEIQESIDHFAFDLAYNDKLKTIKTNPLAFFMGTLKKGDYYNPASNYESQKARNMRLSLEAKMQRQQAEKELEDKLKEAEWKEWVEGLTEQELMEFYVEQTPMASGIPERVQKTLKRKNALANAREYFEGEVWPQRKKEVLNENA